MGYAVAVGVTALALLARWPLWPLFGGEVPYITFFLAVIIAAWYGYRSFKREATRVSQRVRQAEKEAQNRANGTLVQDPKTGEYYVKKD